MKVNESNVKLKILNWNDQMNDLDKLVRRAVYPNSQVNWKEVIILRGRKAVNIDKYIDLMLSLDLSLSF